MQVRQKTEYEKLYHERALVAAGSFRSQERKQQEFPLFFDRKRGDTMSEQTYFLSFEGVSEAEANRYAEELREVLLDAEASLAVQRQRENPLTQDLGASLVLIMGTPAVLAAVQAIGNWLQKRRSASLTIVTAEKKIVAENLTNKDAAHLLELFLTQTASYKEPDL